MCVSIVLYINLFFLSLAQSVDVYVTMNKKKYQRCLLWSRTYFLEKKVWHQTVEDRQI